MTSKTDLEKLSKRGFQLLAAAFAKQSKIKSYQLPDGKGGLRTDTKPDEFMFMDLTSDGEGYLFKHRLSRQYIDVRLVGSGAVSIKPRGDSYPKSLKENTMLGPDPINESRGVSYTAYFESSSAAGAFHRNQLQKMQIAGIPLTRVQGPRGGKSVEFTVTGDAGSGDLKAVEQAVRSAGGDLDRKLGESTMSGNVGPNMQIGSAFIQRPRDQFGISQWEKVGQEQKADQVMPRVGVDNGQKPAYTLDDLLRQAAQLEAADDGGEIPTSLQRKLRKESPAYARPGEFNHASGGTAPGKKQKVKVETTVAFDKSRGFFLTEKKADGSLTDKEQSEINVKQWAKWQKNPKKKLKYTGNTPMPSHYK